MQRVCSIWLWMMLATAAQAELIVYGDVPGAEASDQFTLSVRPLGGDAPWRSAFAFIKRCKQGQRGKNAYFPHLNGWSNTYINFEMAAPVEVEIARVNGAPIARAKAHPQHKAKTCELRNGKAYVVLERPCQIAVDIDGQMDEQDTGKGYGGPPIHMVTIFANPVIADRPKLDDPGVHAVAPGQTPPSEGPWKTLYFLPGVHEIGVAFPVHANRRYYMPGDAIVYGTLSNHDQWKDGHDIRIFGYGTLSGARVAHPDYVSPAPAKAHRHSPIHIIGAHNSTIEGITIADSAYHSVIMPTSFEADRPTVMRWLKILTWRANGDGINPFDNGLVEDCFIRTQDDATYASGRGIRRVTYWNDYNGSTFVLSRLPNTPLVVEDCGVICARAGWEGWSGGRLFNMRGEGGGDCGAGVVFRNIRVSDPRPTLQHFMIAMQGLKPYLSPDIRRRPGHLAGLRFQNIEIAAPSVLGEPDVLWGAPNAHIKDLVFENVSIGGKAIDSLEHFKHNAHVKAASFK